MNKSKMDRMENKLRERLMKERWQKTAEQESGSHSATNKEIADEKIGKWLSAALEDPTTCGAMKDDINEWFMAVEEERLRSKKKSIHDELYDSVKMEMFKASSALEGIEYEHQVEGWDIENPEELQELLEHMIQRINLLEDGDNR